MSFHYILEEDIMEVLLHHTKMCITDPILESYIILHFQQTILPNIFLDDLLAIKMQISIMLHCAIFPVRNAIIFLE